MTVNNNDINVYFHMKNHYRKLSNVRSKIDSSPPKVFRKALESSAQAEMALNKANIPCEELLYGRNICPLAGQRCNIKGRILSHTCVNRHSPMKSANQSRSLSVPPRPQNKLSPYETSTKLRKSKSHALQGKFAIREDSQSGVTRTKRTKQTRCYSDIPLLKNLDQDLPASNRGENNGGTSSKTQGTESSRSSMATSSDNSRKNGRSSRSKTDEHEYLQFLLRITEDVIMNNYFKNEDIQRVFKSHIEANRGRLQMNKMELQLTRLSKELNIPYMPICQSTIEKETREGPKLPDTPINTENLGDCECTTKRTLQFMNFPNRYLPYEDINFASNLENILVNRHSLGRVTECTEPTNSLDTIYNANNKFSVVTVASSLGVDSLAPSSQQNVSDRSDKSDGSFDEVSGSILTDKEKIGSIEEDILFNKLHSRSLPLISNNHSSLRPEILSPNVTSLATIDNDSLTRTDSSNKTVLSRDSLTPEAVSSENIDNMPLDKENTNTEPSKDEHKLLDQDIPGKLKGHVTTCGESQDIRDSSLAMDEKEVLQAKQQKAEKFTQIMVEHLEKECNTNKDVKIIEKDDDYILINKPIYVLRNIVESKDGLVYFTEQPKEDVVEELQVENPVEVEEEESKTTAFENPSDSDICLKDANQSDYSMNAESIERDSLYNNYSRLLNSDYDLTPQRDSDVGNKYHYLMLDATTSISNVNLPSRNDLLLTDNYALRSDLSDESNHHLNVEKEYCISDDGQYEIMSYNMNNAFPARSAQETRRHFLQTSEIAKKKSQLTISLSNYEINSEISMSTGQYYDGNSESESGLYPLAYDIPVRK